MKESVACVQHIGLNELGHDPVVHVCTHPRICNPRCTPQEYEFNTAFNDISFFARFCHAEPEVAATPMKAVPGKHTTRSTCIK
jgi:hypothetical protein